MKKILLLFTVSCVLISFNACTDLDEVLVGEQTESFNGSEPSFGSFDGGGAGPSDAINSAFAQLRESGSANHGGYWSVQSVSSDEMAVTQKGGDWFDGGIWIDMHRHTYTSTNGPINGAWGQQYSAIGECNNLLAGSLDANQTAQVRALRAFFYYRLLDMWGNVKIVTTPGVDAPQSTRAQVFNFVETELLAALGVPSITSSMDLSASPLTTNQEVYRINQFAALGLLAKLYLNAEVYTGTPRYSEAAMAAGYVIDNGGYMLVDSGYQVENPGKRPAVASDPDMLSGYATIFAPNNESNPEMVWSIPYDNVSGPNMNFARMTLHYANQFTYNLSSQPWNGYSALEEFYNSYDDSDVRKKANFIIGTQLDYQGSVIVDYAESSDLELTYTAEINELEPNASREGGARLGKFSFRQGGQDNMDNDYPIIRLGDLYLIRAEGLARAAGDWNMALPDVNTIRNRAGLTTPLGSLTADEFLAERGREMFMEVTRRQDLIRFGKWGDSWWEKTNSDAHKTLFPIPQEQIDASGGTLTQNPGY